ncbi:MAX dimerization protein MGA a isoform X2 [Gouania willdenowi]|uniref:MAX dimerization protein MGA a isoform X2 n=1 Tax=Gouania willdenowi TaxID=441366 RepID=UPI0010553979|nr:uncharacterized protein LOC114456525 isoform X2 [Gouania willdenowi]
MASNRKTDPEKGAGSSVRGVHWSGREENLQLEQECRGVRVSLENHRMWREFCRCRTEMVASNQGSRMFPYCRFSIAGLQPSRNYCLQLVLRLNHRNQFIWTGSNWEASGPAHTQAKVSGRPFTHPDSPAPGRHWMDSPVSFYRLKLTNGATQQEGAVPLTPNHRYLPTLLVLPADRETDKTLSFSFPQTEFMAVLSYQNKALSQLKVHYNPFSKGPAPLTPNSPRGRGRHTDSERRTGGGGAQPHPVKSLKSLLANHKERKCRAPPPNSLSSSTRPNKLFSELIREAHVSLHRCNVDHLGRVTPTSKPPTSLTAKEQEVVSSDRTPTEALPVKVQSSEVKLGFPGVSSEASPKQNKCPARLPLPALALFLKQHATKSSKRKEAPPTDSTQHRPHPSDSTQHRPHTPGLGPDPETVNVGERSDHSRTCLASEGPEPSVCDVLSSHASSPIAPPSSCPLRSQPSSKPSDWAALLPDPECSSLGFEPLSPASSPEPLPSLPASLTYDLEDSVGQQGAASPGHASSVFQWHTVLPPQDQQAEAPSILSYTDPQSPHRAPPGSPSLSPLVLSLSPSFSSLDGDGLSPTSSLADLVQLLSNTDDFSTTDLTNDQSAGADLANENLSVDSFSTGCHVNNNNNNNGGMNDDKGVLHNHTDDVIDSAVDQLSYRRVSDDDDDEDLNPTCTEEGGPRSHHDDNHSLSTDPLVCVLADEHASIQPPTIQNSVGEDLTETSPPSRVESTYRTTTRMSPPPREESTYRTTSRMSPPPREESTYRTLTSSPPMEESTYRTTACPSPPPMEESTYRTTACPSPPPMEESTYRTTACPSPPPMEESTYRTTACPSPPPMEESAYRTMQPSLEEVEEQLFVSFTTKKISIREDTKLKSGIERVQLRTNAEEGNPDSPELSRAHPIWITGGGGGNDLRLHPSQTHPPMTWLESDSELGPISESEGLRDDLAPLNSPPPSNDLAPLESDSELAPPLPEAPPPRPRVVLRQRDLENAALLDGHARTAITEEALKLHTCESSEEAEPQRAERRPEHDGPQQNIVVFQDQLLGDLQLMKHRQVIHPVLQEVGLKMNLLDSQSAVDLQYLGVLLPIPLPGTEAGPPSQAPPCSAAFVSRTGKASTVTQIKGWRDRFSPSEAPPPAAECSLQGLALAEPQKKKNLSAFCSDMLDEYLENEGKLLEQQVCSFSQAEENPPLYSCSYAPTPSPASQIISAFVPPSKRPRVPEVKRRGRKPRQPRAEQSPPHTGHRRRRRKRSEAPPLTDPPSNDMAPLESDSELGPISETEGLRDDLAPLNSPPPSNDLAPLESDSELAPPLPEAPPPRPRVVLRQRDLENAALWDGHARTAITEGRASVALTSLFTLKGFVCEDPLAPVQMECRRPPPCLNDFCRLGCVCDSLSGMRRPAHCARPTCMFSCSCLKQKVVVLRNMDSASPQGPRRRKRRKRRRMKMAYILKEVDHVSEPSPLLRTLWTNQRAVDPEPLHVPRVIVPAAAQEVQCVPSSCARVRAFTNRQGATAVQQQAGRTIPVKSVKPSEMPSGSAPRLLPSRRLLVHADCEWRSDLERSDVLQQLCEALTSQNTRKTFWIKDYLVRVGPSSAGSDRQYRAHISRPQGPGPGRPGPGRPRKSHSSVRPEEPCDQGTNVLTQQGEKPGEVEGCGSSALPLLTGVSPAGFLSANRREVGGTKQVVAVNGKLYPRAKIQLGMMGALHPANWLAALLTGRVGSMRPTPSLQQAPPIATVNDDIMSVNNEGVVSVETEPVDLTSDSETDSEVDEKNQRHNLQEKQRRQELRQHFDFLRREIGLKNPRSAKIRVLNQAVQIIKQLEEKEVELISRKSDLQSWRDETLLLISSKEGAEPKARSPKVTADNKDKYGANQLSGGGGAIVPRAPSPPVSAPPSSPVQVLFKTQRTMPNILLHNKHLKKNHIDGEFAEEASKVHPLLPQQPLLTVSNLIPGQLVLQGRTNPGLNKVTLSVPNPTNQQLHLVSLSHPQTATNTKNVIKVLYPPLTQQQLQQQQQTQLQQTQQQQQQQTNINLLKVYFSPTQQPTHVIQQLQQTEQQQQPTTNTKLIKVHIVPQTQQLHNTHTQQQKTELLQSKQPVQALPTHKLLLQTQPLQLIGPAVSCDSTSATNGWTTATNENLQNLLSELGFFNQQATPMAEAPPTETLVGVANQRTEEVELNRLSDTHLETKTLPPLMQMNVGGAKLIDTLTTGTAEMEIGAGVEGGALRPMPRLLKGNPPT